MKSKILDKNKKIIALLLYFPIFIVFTKIAQFVLDKLYIFINIPSMIYQSIIAILVYLLLFTALLVLIDEKESKSINRLSGKDILFITAVAFIGALLRSAINNIPAIFYDIESLKLFSVIFIQVFDALIYIISFVLIWSFVYLKSKSIAKNVRKIFTAKSGPLALIIIVLATVFYIYKDISYYYYMQDFFSGSSDSIFGYLNLFSGSSNSSTALLLWVNFSLVIALLFGRNKEKANQSFDSRPRN